MKDSTAYGYELTSKVALIIHYSNVTRVHPDGIRLIGMSLHDRFRLPVVPPISTRYISSVACFSCRNCRTLSVADSPRCISHQIARSARHCRQRLKVSPLRAAGPFQLFPCVSLLDHQEWSGKILDCKHVLRIKDIQPCETLNAPRFG